MPIKTAALEKKAEELSLQYYEEGFYCSEAVLKSFEQLSGLEFPEMLKKGMTAFGEGLGATGCVCGAINSAVFIASMYAGRLDASDSPKQIQKVSEEMITEFTYKYGSTCCRVITKKAGKLFGIGKYKHCPEITARCASKLVEVGVREGWLSADQKQSC